MEANTTHHDLASCPCEACVTERERLVLSYRASLIRISVKAARLFRFIPSDPLEECDLISGEDSWETKKPAC